MTSCYCGTIACHGEKCNEAAYKLEQLEPRVKVVDELNKWLKSEAHYLEDVEALEEAEAKVKELESKLAYAQQRVRMFERMWV